MPAPELRLASNAGRWVLALSVLGSAIAFLEATVVNAALPELGRDLDADVAGLQWVINGYLITLAALILLGGSLGDRYGRRRIFELGVVWLPPGKWWICRHCFADFESEFGWEVVETDPNVWPYPPPEPSPRPTAADYTPPGEWLERPQ